MGPRGQADAARDFEAGRIAHKGATYEGQHEAIIDAEAWGAVRARLTDNAQDRRSATGAVEPSLLVGIIYDQAGMRLTPSHAVKNGKRYRYYVSQSLLQNRNTEDGSITRLPAQEIEGLVGAQIRVFLKSPAKVIDELAGPDASPRDQHRILMAAKKPAAHLLTRNRAAWWSFIQAVVKRVSVGEREVEVVLSRRRLRQALLGNRSAAEAAKLERRDSELDHPADSLSLRVEAKLKRCSGEMRLVLPAGAHSDLMPRPNATLIKALTRAHKWWNKLLSGEAPSIRAIAKEEGLTERPVSRILRLAFLAPDIVEAILEGYQPADLELERLIKSVPISWREQRKVLGLSRG